MNFDEKLEEALTDPIAALLTQKNLRGDEIAKAFSSFEGLTAKTITRIPGHCANIIDILKSAQGGAFIASLDGPVYIVDIDRSSLKPLPSDLHIDDLVQARYYGPDVEDPYMKKLYIASLIKPGVYEVEQSSNALNSEVYITVPCVMHLVITSDEIKTIKYFDP